MVEHNLSMSLNHHVPIFKRTSTGLGGGSTLGLRPLPPSVTSPVLGHVTLLSGPRALSWMAVPVSVCIHYRFSASETEVNPPHPPLHSDLFLPGRNFFFSALIQTGGFFFSRFPWSEINLSITHECKGYLSNDLKESSALLFPRVSLCTPPALPEEMQCMFFLAWWRVQITG